MGLDEPPSAQTLSTPRLIWLGIAFVLAPQIVAIFVVPGIAEGTPTRPSEAHSSSS